MAIFSIFFVRGDILGTGNRDHMLDLLGAANFSNSYDEKEKQTKDDSDYLIDIK